jgi:hypothetical protein
MPAMLQGLFLQVQTMVQPVQPVCLKNAMAYSAALWLARAV